MIKIAIAHISKAIQSSIAQILSQNAFCELIWTAEDLEEIQFKFFNNPPDFLILDINLIPLEAPQFIQLLLKKHLCHILLTTSDIAANADKIFDSLGQGAAEVICMKNENLDKDTHFVDQFLFKLNKILRLEGRDAFVKAKPRRDFLSSKRSQHHPLIVIGASTGGPLAISQIISNFPPHVNFTVVIIQHLDAAFIPNLISWLSGYSKIPVKEALPGTRLEPGVIYLAAKEQHLVINKAKQFEYINLKTPNVYAPSIDVFFESLAENWIEPEVAVLLTGMGSDGAVGLKKLFDHSWYTIVQNQESCVVYGMPKIAVNLGAAHEILPIKEIGPRILNLLGY